MPFVIIYNKIANYYRRTSIELKRLNSLAKSPTTTAFTEMIAGCSSIRGYDASDDFSGIKWHFEVCACDAQ